MLHAYLNYPAQRGRLHHDLGCGHVAKRDVPSDRIRQVRPDTFGAELAALDDLTFRAEAGVNAVWLDLDFDDPVFEAAVARYLLRRLGARYTRLAAITLEDCC